LLKCCIHFDNDRFTDARVSACNRNAGLLFVHFLAYKTPGPAFNRAPREGIYSTFSGACPNFLILMDFVVLKTVHFIHEFSRIL
jgi:hypothetical protein